MACTALAMGIPVDSIAMNGRTMSGTELAMGVPVDSIAMGGWHRAGYGCTCCFYRYGSVF